MAPPRPRSKRAAAHMDDEDAMLVGSASKKKVVFKGEPQFYDEDHMNGHGRDSIADDTHGFGPHIIKVMDQDMLDRVCQKYEKMGHSVQRSNNIIKLNVIKASTCLQEEIFAVFGDNLDHPDMSLVSSTGQEIPCHRFILSVRSPVFKKLLSAQTSAELLREPIDASTDAVKTMVKYLYTDTLDNQDINEDLMNLADKYELTQMKELCLPSFVKKIKAENCLKAYIYGYLHNYEPLKFAAFHMLDENWKNYENSSDLIEMMKSHPTAALEILNRLYKKKGGYLVRSPQINLKMIKAFQCVQEEIIKSYNDRLDHCDVALVSNTGQEIPCHRFILATRSADLKNMLAMQGTPPEGLLKINMDASTGAVGALVKYLYTDSVDNDDITEDLIALATKYKLTQLRDYCLPTLIEMISSENCLTMYVYGYKQNNEQVKTAAFKILDENWKLYHNNTEFLDVMKTCPNAVLEIMSRLHKVSDCQPIVLENVKPRLVDF